MGFHVDSEVGRLKQVVVHRPGLELSRLTPQNVDELLFDDVMWATKAREEHAAFVGELQDKGVVVHHFADLLAEVLETDDGREFVLERVATDETVGPKLVQPLRELAREHRRQDPGRLLHRRDHQEGPAAAPRSLSCSATSSTTTSSSSRHSPTTCSSATTRPGSTTGCRCNPMAKPARQREIVHSRAIYNFHPMFAGEGLHFWYGNDDGHHEPATCEGGDILVLGNRTVMIGMGERTTPQGIETLVRS